MKPSLPRIDPPTKCGAIRSKYSDSGQTQTFINAVQAKIDSIGSYVTNSLANDLKSVRDLSDFGTLFKNLVRYVRLEKKTGNVEPTHLAFNQIQVFDENSNSISLNKPARSSSVYGAITGPASGVNGRTGSKENFCATNREASPWWEVDLGNPSRVSRVLFTNILYPEAQSMANAFQLILLNQNRETISSFPLTANQTQEFIITSPSNQSQVIAEKMSELSQTEKELQEAMGCLDQEINQRQTISSDIYNLQGQVKEKEKRVDTKYVNVKAAKERAHLLRDPSADVTVWESWFPLGRPLEKHSVPVLWFFSIVFLILSIGLFLQMVGFKLDIGGKVDQATAVLQKTSAGLKGALQGATGANPKPSAPPINLSKVALPKS